MRTGCRLFWVLVACGPLLGSPQTVPGESRYRIAWSTYLGGIEWDQAREVQVCPDGSVLVGAQTCSAQMPVGSGALQPRYAGDDPSLGHPGVYGGDCYLAHLSADGSKVLAGTYFGGSKQERNVYGMALDAEGNVVIASATRSTDAPVTQGCFQHRFAGGPSDMLVAKVTGDLQRVLWCTYLGGSGDDFPRGGIALDEQGAVFVVGTSTSADFPTTAGVVQPKLSGPRDSVIVKLSQDGSKVLFATFLGGTGEDDAIMGLRLDRLRNIYVAGHTRSDDFPVSPFAPQRKAGGKSDCYFAKLSPDASRLLFATYLGGSGEEFAEHRPWLTPEGALILTGFTSSEDFPATEGACQRKRNGPSDGFVARLSSDGRRWDFATYLGGSGGENWLMPTLDRQGNLIVVGSTSSRDFPVTEDALQKRYGGGTEDGALAVLSGDGQRLLYATYLGGTGEEMIRSIALGPDGSLYLVGNTSSPDFPVTASAFQKHHAGKGDGFVMKLSPGG